MKDITINPNFEHVFKIINALKTNTEQYGYPYCPCKINKTEDNICPCNDFMINHVCKCKLFISD